MPWIIEYLRSRITYYVTEMLLEMAADNEVLVCVGNMTRSVRYPKPRRPGFSLIPFPHVTDLVCVWQKLWPALSWRLPRENDNDKSDFFSRYYSSANHEMWTIIVKDCCFAIKLVAGADIVGSRMCKILERVWIPIVYSKAQTRCKFDSAAQQNSIYDVVQKHEKFLIPIEACTISLPGLALPGLSGFWA